MGGGLLEGRRIWKFFGAGLRFGRNVRSHVLKDFENEDIFLGGPFIFSDSK